MENNMIGGWVMRRYFVVAFWFFLFSSLLFLRAEVQALDYPPGIFLNDLPGPIEIRPGEEPRIPLFLLLGPFANQEVEFFVWREWQGDTQGLVESQEEYLDQNLTWQPLGEYSALKPFVVAQLPKYLRFDWRSNLFLAPFDWSNHQPPEGLSYRLNICFDTRVDGVPPTPEDLSSQPPRAVCGQTSVTFTQSNACQISSINMEGPSPISATVFTALKPHYKFSFRDNCQNPPSSCQVESPSYIVASYNNGSLDITFSNISVGEYNDNLIIKCISGSYNQEFKVPINIKVFETPGVCDGQIVLVDNNGQRFASGSTINLSVPQSFQVKCAQKVLTQETDIALLNYAYLVDNPCLQIQNNNGQLVINTDQEECSGVLKVAAGNSSASFSLQVNKGQGPILQQNCIPQVYPTNLSFRGSGAQEVSVKDSCGQMLAYTVTSVEGAWINYPSVGISGNGSLTVRVNDHGLRSGTYRGKVVLSLQNGSSILINVTLNTNNINNTPSRATLELWPTEIDLSLNSGETQEKTLYATCSGDIPSRCSISKKSGGSWLKVVGCEGAEATIKVDATGLSTGQTYKGSVLISTSCGSKTVPVNLEIQGACEADHVIVSKPSVTVSVQQGLTAKSQSVSVKDNCGEALTFEASIAPTSAQEWLQVSKKKGVLTLRFSSSNLDLGTYRATVTINTSLGAIDLPVKLTITEKPTTNTPPSKNNTTPSNPTGTIALQNGSKKKLNFEAGEVKVFSFYASASSQIPLSVVVGVPSSYSFGYTQMLLVNAGPSCDAPPPTAEQIQSLLNRFYNREIRSRGHEGNTYWYLGGGLVKNLLVREDIEKSCWYLLIYNSHEKSYRNVTVAFSSPDF